MNFILVFTFITMAGLTDIEELEIDNVDNKAMCMALAPQAISTWATLAGVHMVEVSSIDCLEVGEDA